MTLLVVVVTEGSVVISEDAVFLPSSSNFGLADSVFWGHADARFVYSVVGVCCPFFCSLAGCSTVPTSSTAAPGGEISWMAVVLLLSSWLRTFVFSVVVIEEESDEGRLDSPDKSSRDVATVSCSRLCTTLSAADVTPNPMGDVLLLSSRDLLRFHDSNSALNADVIAALIPVFSKELDVLSAEAAERASGDCPELCTLLSMLLWNGE